MENNMNDYSSSAPSISKNPNHTGLITWIFFYSFLFWIPYTIFTFYLFHEHNVRKQYPQNFIMFLFAVGCLCRCIWFGLYSDFGYYNSMQILNRVAILFQFSAISLLLLMWSRALKVSEDVDKRAAHNRIQSGRFNINNKIPPDGTRIVPSTNTNGTDGKYSSVLERLPTITPAFERTDTITQPFERTSTWVNNTNGNTLTNIGTVQSANEPELRRKRIICLAATIVAWIIVLGTIIGNPDSGGDMYIYNMISLVVLSFAVSAGIVIVGMQNWHRLRKELSTVYTSGVVNTNERKGKNSLNRLSVIDMTVYYMCCYCGTNSGCFGFVDYLNELWDLLFSSSRHKGPSGQVRLRIQTEVLRIVLVVSLSVGFFFLLRCYAFSYYSIFQQQFGVTSAPLADKYYPYLFYQLPEFFPNLLIARGISPPKGILRRIQTYIQACFVSCLGLKTLWKSFRKSFRGESSSHSSFNSNRDSSKTPDTHPKHGNKMDADEQEYEQRVSMDDFGYSPFRARVESDVGDVVVKNPIVVTTDRQSSITEHIKIEDGIRSSMANRSNRTLSDELSDYIYSISSYNPSYDVSRNTSVGSSLTQRTTNNSNSISRGNSGIENSSENNENPSEVEMNTSMPSKGYMENLDEYY